MLFCSEAALVAIVYGLTYRRYMEKHVEKLMIILYLQKSLDLVGLVISWGSSNNHGSFSPIPSPCREL